MHSTEYPQLCVYIRRSTCYCFARVVLRYGGDTVYLTVADQAGNMVSLIQSLYNGFGSGLVAPGTGFCLQDRGALFAVGAAAIAAAAAVAALFHEKQRTLEHQ